MRLVRGRRVMPHVSAPGTPASPAPWLPPVTRGMTVHLGASGQSYELGALRSWDNTAPGCDWTNSYFGQHALTKRPTLSSLNGYPCPSYSHAASQRTRQTGTNTT